MAELFFRELRGDYVENVGQVVNPREYLDYLEPLGSALSRRPDGVGGPFVYQFRGGGGRVVGAMGWVVSAASKRYGGWNLWGVWTDGAIPALALPLCWRELENPDRLPSLLRRVNQHADALQRREASPELLDAISSMPLDDAALRNALKIELSRLYRLPLPGDRPLEIDLHPSMLDLLPWLYLLGPVEPGLAQLQPSRFNGAGYQYILTDTPPAEVEVLDEIDAIVDTTANDVPQGFELAVALRERRARPPRKAVAPKPRPSQNQESLAMRNEPTPRRIKPQATASREPAPTREIDMLPTMLRAVRDVVVIALLAWIGFNVHQLRKSMTAAPSQQAAAVATDTQTLPAAPPVSREQRIADALTARPPDGIRLTATAVDDLPRTAVEIFLRRNGCFSRTEPVDGRFSAAEQRAIRTCTALTNQRLMRSGTEPHAERAVEWLEGTLDAR